MIFPLEMIAKVDSDAYCVTFGAKPARTPIKQGEKLLFNFVCVRNKDFTIVQSGLNFYVLATGDFGEPE